MSFLELYPNSTLIPNLGEQMLLKADSLFASGSIYGAHEAYLRICRVFELVGESLTYQEALYKLVLADCSVVDFCIDRWVPIALKYGPEHPEAKHFERILTASEGRLGLSARYFFRLDDRYRSASGLQTIKPIDVSRLLVGPDCVTGNEYDRYLQLGTNTSGYFLIDGVLLATIESLYSSSLEPYYAPRIVPTSEKKFLNFHYNLDDIEDMEEYIDYYYSVDRSLRTLDIVRVLISEKRASLDRIKTMEAKLEEQERRYFNPSFTDKLKNFLGMWQWFAFDYGSASSDLESTRQVLNLINETERTSNLVKATFDESSEITIGRQSAAIINSQNNVYIAPQITSMVNRVGRNSSRPHLHYHAYVIEGIGINAFAMPGGYVYISKELIDFVQNSEGGSEMLAGVIAHEISHIARQHAIKNLRKRLGWTVIDFAASKLSKKKYNEQLAAMLANLAMLKFSRDQELEADEQAIELLRRAGYNPNAIYWFLTKLQPLENNSIPGFLKTHPSIEDRLRALREAGVGEAQVSFAQKCSSPTSASENAHEPTPVQVQRRSESQSVWSSALNHKGTFHVHVLSANDSVRALSAVNRLDLKGYPYRLKQVEVNGRTWVRILVGRFPDLVSASAFRDSLLDKTGIDYCSIGVDPEPMSTR